MRQFITLTSDVHTVFYGSQFVNIKNIEKHLSNPITDFKRPKKIIRELAGWLSG